MNKEEILAMEAGLELDMLVGQYVIGFEDYLKESGKRPVVRDGRYGKNYFDLPNYSVDISAAWEVVESMKKLNWWVVLSIADDKWNALFFWDPEQEAFEAQSSVAPEAICKAALLAVME